MPDIDPTTAGLPGPSLSATAEAEVERRRGKVRLRAALISFGMGAIPLGSRFWAYHLTLSTAVLSDALESIVNVDAHIVVPMFRDVGLAHDATDDFEQRVIQVCGLKGEIVIHTDPCRQLYCAQCDLPECPVRRETFRVRPALTVEEAVHPDPPLVLQP
jgi:divalent metal cation (Fe/Co/Zn/Cd) transporter